MESQKLSIPFYVTVGLIAGAIIAYQIGIMRVFSVGTWSHFGSLVVSMAMLGFGVMSAVMCVGTGFFERHWAKLVALSLYTFGPLMVLGNTAAQMVGFNPVELVANPEQKYNLFWLFVLYFVPFLPGALFLGLAFLRGQAVFGRVYFADLAGSGLCGLIFLVGMYVVVPDEIILVPVALWLAGALVWFGARRAFASAAVAVVLAGGAWWVTTAKDEAGNPRFAQIVVNEFKGVSYAKKFPDAKRIYWSASPFGYVEVYASSYFHFAPGLSDNAVLNLPDMPKDAYLGLYVDSDGPIGIIKKMPDKLKAYYEYLPMYLPYVLKKQPQVFVVQLGGGISTELARAVGAKAITVAEGNPAILRTLRSTKVVTDLTGDPLKDPRVTVIEYDGRLYIRNQRDKYDVIDLSLADSTGLSSPGGFAIVEKYNYTRETLVDYMNALAPSGILSITLWNKEDLPKAVPKFLATVIAAARDREAAAGGRPEDVANKFVILHTYLSTATVLYKRDGFTPEETARLTKHVDDMSFEMLYKPGMTIDMSEEEAIYNGYRATHFDFEGSPERAARERADKAKPGNPPKQGDEAKGEDDEGEDKDAAKRPKLSWANVYKLMIARYLKGEFAFVQEKYVFDTRPLTNERPYFAGYIKALDIPKFLDQLDAVSDEWGYLLLWATLGLALIFGISLMLFPVIWGWKTIFSRVPGKLGIFTYYFCLGTGYIIVEVGLISKFTVALGNPAISASVLITGMLFFTGLGSLFTTRYLDRCRTLMPKIFIAIAALLAGGALFYDAMLQAIGSWPYVLRIVACLALVAPAAFLMGFPFATGMAMLSKLGKERFFIWAWGINGCFSVVGAVAVPIVSVLFGHSVLIMAAAVIYLVAWPAFFYLLKPIPGARPA
jgi:spermidine synthase